MGSRNVSGHESILIRLQKKNSSCILIRASIHLQISSYARDEISVIQAIFSINLLILSIFLQKLYGLILRRVILTQLLVFLKE